MISVDLFFQRMVEYNTAIWPMQVVTYLLGIGVVLLAMKRWTFSSQVIALILAAFWIFNGVVELMVFFGSVSRQYYFWGSVWIGQGLLLVLMGVFQRTLDFAIHKRWPDYLGLSVIAFALLIYPLLGYASGHGFPQGPVFGVAPCPVCIFTCGVLLFNKRRTPIALVMIPLIWSLMGTFAVVILRVYADLGEVIVGVATALVIMHNNRRVAQRYAVQV